MMTKNKKNKKNKTKTNKSKSKNNAPQRVYGTASPPSPPPPSSPPQRLYGEMCIEYCIINKCTTFSYGSRETRYYQGWVKYEDDSNEENVSFMCFDDLQTAARVFNCSGRVNHPRVIRPIFYTFDEKINEPLVCFERFDGFLPDAKHEFLASLKSPNLLCAVPGNPNEIVQEEIRELCHALECMHLANVSSTLLQVRGGYVWSNQKLKIIADCREEDQINKDWSDMKLRHINSFKIGLNNFFLRTGVRWEAKKSFMKCFSVSISSEEKRLSMVYTHPFLEKDKKTILKIFPEIYHALNSRRYQK